MSPRSTLKSCGSSSSRYLRSTRPSGVTRPPNVADRMTVTEGAERALAGMVSASFARRVRAMPSGADLVTRIISTSYAAALGGVGDLRRGATTAFVGELLQRLPAGAGNVPLGERRRRQIEFAVKPRAPAGLRLHLELRPHRLDQLAADRETEAGPGEGEAASAGRAPERLVQTGQGLRVNPVSGVSHGELDQRSGPGLRHDFDEALLRELDRVAREVEQYPAERH